MLGPVDHLDTLVERSSCRGVVRKPDTLHRCDRDDTCALAAHGRGVDHRRLRGVVRPLVVRHLLLPPLEAAARQVDGDDRVRARVRARAGSTGSRAASRNRCRSRACSWSDRPSSVSRRRRRRRACRTAASSVPAGGIVQNGFGQAGVRSVWYAITKPRTPYSEPAAPTISRWLAQIGALVSE